jgi:hypothetical protein
MAVPAIALMSGLFNRLMLTAMVSPILWLGLPPAECQGCHHADVSDVAGWFEQESYVSVETAQAPHVLVF